MCETRDRPLTATVGAPAARPAVVPTRVGGPACLRRVSGESTSLGWDGAVCTERIPISQNLPPTAVHLHARMGRFDQTDKLDEPGVVWLRTPPGTPPRAAATGWSNHWERASLWPLGGGQAGSLCCRSRASRVREVGVGPPLPATCLLPGPLPPEQESKARGLWIGSEKQFEPAPRK